MPTTRSYRDLCPIARALDAVGERWALLVVRELLLAPQRFTDLRRALPGASSNMLTDRLRELEAHGIIHRRALPPASSRAYELTDRGRALEPVLDALGAWGAAEPPPRDGSVSATSVLLFLCGCVRAQPEPPTATYRLQLDDRAWTLWSHHGQFEVAPGEPPAADASLRTDPATLNDLLLARTELNDAILSGAARVSGDRRALRRLLEVARSA